MAGAAGGLVLSASAFLVWFSRAEEDFTANDIPALVLLRHVDRATSLRLGHLAIAIGVLVALASLLPSPWRGWTQLAASSAALAGVVTFAAQLMREVNAPGISTSLLDHLGVGAFAGGGAALLSLFASVGGFTSGFPSLRHPVWAPPPLPPPPESGADTAVQWGVDGAANPSRPSGTCPSCGRSVEEDANFCRHCGGGLRA